VTRPYQTNHDLGPTHSSRLPREPEHFHFSRGVSRLQKHRHAVVDGEGFQRPRLARAEIVFWKGPVSVLHIDTTYEFPEMLEFRDWATKHYNLNLIVKINTEARERGIGYETHDPDYRDT
jgi:hypothetical protein